MQPLDYWQKITEKNPFSELEWNVPEQKTGTINIIGGNSNNFSGIIRSAEFANANFPIKKLNVLLPEPLKNKLPPLPNLNFLPATESGSFAKSSVLNTFVSNADFSIFIGDFSKNSATTIAIADAIKTTMPADTPSKDSIKATPALLTRDTIDLLTPEMPSLIEHKNLFLVGSMAQLQKVFRAVYYPKMLLLSMPLLPAVEALHKFTLSYPVTILTFHQEQIIVANGGRVATLPIKNTNYTPISLWNGDLACKIALNNLYSPGKPYQATIFSINHPV